MKKLIAISSIVFALALGTAVWLNARNPASKSNPASTNAPTSEPLATPSAPAPIIGATAASPTIIAVNTPTAVTVTAVITDPFVIPTGVNLLRLNANGMSTVLGQLKDDGTNGDAVAGDKTFTILKMFNESATGEIKLQVSAAFRGILKRALSNIILINVWNSFNDPLLLFQFYYPPSWELSLEGSKRILYGPVALAEINAGDLVIPPDITISLLDNPSSTSIADFVSAYRSGWFVDYAELGAISIDRHEGVFVSDLGDPVPRIPELATFIATGNRVILLTSRASAQRQFDALLASIKFQ